MAIGTLGPGGAEKQLSLLANYLCGSGRWAVHVAASTSGTSGDFYRNAICSSGAHFWELPDSSGINSGASSIRVPEPWLRRRPPPLDAVPEMYRLIMRIRPSVVHAWMDETNIVAGLAAALAGVPRIILSVRSHNPTHFPFYRWPMRSVYLWLLRNPSVVMSANSRAGAIDYERWLNLNSGTIRVITNGLDTASLPPLPLSPTSSTSDARVSSAITSHTGVPRSRKTVLGIMRFSDEKRPLLWLAIAACVAERDDSIDFRLVGEGPLSGDMLAFARNFPQLDGRLTFCGTTDTPLSEMVRSDLVLLTSRVEGLPNVLIEAQALGVPIVASDIAGVREVILPECTAVLVSSDNVGDWALEVHGMLQSSSQRASSAIEGAQYARERYSVEKSAEKWLGLYATQP